MAAAAGTVCNKTQEEFISNLHFLGVSYCLKNGIPKRYKAKIPHINTTVSLLAQKLTGKVCNKDYLHIRHHLNLLLHYLQCHKKTAALLRI